VFAQWATDYLTRFVAAWGNLKELLKLTFQHESKKKPRKCPWELLISLQ